MDDIRRESSDEESDNDKGNDVTVKKLTNRAKKRHKLEAARKQAKDEKKEQQELDEIYARLCSVTKEDMGSEKYVDDITRLIVAGRELPEAMQASPNPEQTKPTQKGRRTTATRLLGKTPRDAQPTEARATQQQVNARYTLFSSLNHTNIAIILGILAIIYWNWPAAVATQDLADKQLPNPGL